MNSPDRFRATLPLLLSVVILFIAVVVATMNIGYRVVPYDPEENRILHHVALTPADIEASLKFYRDGIGLKVILDMNLAGNWSGVFNARSDELRSIFLGDPDRPEAGVVELVYFQGGHDEREPLSEPSNGFFLLSFVVDLDQTLVRLQALGFAQEAVVDTPVAFSPTRIALIRDPDGVWVELIPFAFNETVIEEEPESGNSH